MDRAGAKVHKCNKHPDGSTQCAAPFVNTGLETVRYLGSKGSASTEVLGCEYPGEDFYWPGIFQRKSTVHIRSLTAPTLVNVRAVSIDGVNSKRCKGNPSKQQRLVNNDSIVSVRGNYLLRLGLAYAGGYLSSR